MDPQDDITRIDDPLGIKPLRRFVQDEEFWMWQERLGQRKPLPHAVRISGHSITDPSGQADKLHDFAQALLFEIAAKICQDPQVSLSVEVIVKGRSFID